MPAGHAQEAELRLAVRRDHVHGRADGLARLASELVAIPGQPDGLGRAGDEVVVVVSGGLRKHRAKGPDDRLAAAADRARAGDMRAEFGHLDVVRYVLQPVADDICHEHVHGVAADVDGGKTHQRRVTQFVRMTARKGTRMEKDSMGEMEVPADAYYGASTQRAVLNFPISGQPFPRRFIRALGLIKKAAAQTNGELRLLSQRRVRAIVKAAQEVVDGKLNDQFPIDVYQTGSGTSTNTNANEVIANRATEILGGARVSKQKNPT